MTDKHVRVACPPESDLVEVPADTPLSDLAPAGQWVRIEIERDGLHQRYYASRRIQ